MCLVTKQKEPLIAKEPIKAFKVLRHTLADKFLSPYQDYDYTECVNSRCIIIGIIPKAEYTISNLAAFYLGIRTVYRGLHLFISKDKAIKLTRNLDGVIFECEIPVGSYYFTNPYGTEICTNQFRFIKEI